MIAGAVHRRVKRYGSDWCATCDTTVAICRHRLAISVVAPAACTGVRIESANYAVWVACSCGFIGPRRTGPADDAWLEAVEDRTNHLTEGAA